MLLSQENDSFKICLSGQFVWYERNLCFLLKISTDDRQKELFSPYALCHSFLYKGNFTGPSFSVILTLT
jgi:hypothetical protein